MAEAVPVRVEELLALRDEAWRLAVRVTGRGESAEDAVQDAYLSALRDLGRGAAPASLRSWFLGAVVHAARNQMRSEARRRRREAAVETRDAASPPSHPDQELLGALNGCLAALDEKHRLPIALCYEHGMSQREAAEVLGQSEGTVFTNVSRGLEKLREALARAGYAAAPAAVLGALGTLPQLAAPPTLAAAVAKIVSGGMITKGTGVAAASAAGKGGLAVKIIAGVVAAGVLAGGFSVFGGRFSSPPTTDNRQPATESKPAPANPFNGMQEREEVFEFTEKPKVAKEGDKWIITFASKANCDATVSILDKDGKIIRHLASGVLGKNAPWPFQQNALAQKIEWDGLTDDFKKAEAAGCKVRVGLGLQAQFDKNIAYDPYLLPGEPQGGSYTVPFANQLLVGTDSEGKFVVGSMSRCSFTVQVFGKDGKYIRTVFPPPAAEAEKVMGGLGHKFAATKWGDKVMICDWMGPFSDLPGDPRTPPAGARTFKDLVEAYPGLAKIIKAQPGVGEVKMMPRPKEIPAAAVPGGGAVVGIKNPHISADRIRDEVYANFGGAVRFSGKTGEQDKTWFPGKDSLASGEGTTECSIGQDGLVYFRFKEKGRFMFRLDHEGKSVPFAKENSENVSPGKAWWISVPGPYKTTGLDAVECGVVNGSMTHQCGLHVAPSGLIAVAGQYLNTAWGQKMGVQWAPKQFSAVLVFDNAGKLLSGNAVGETHAGQGVSMDREGNVYAVISGTLPAGQKTFEGSEVPANTNGGCTSLVKFRGLGGKYPLNVGPGAKVGKGEGLPGAAWVYGGVSSSMKGCYCHQTRHDMDPWARAWLPSNQFYSVTVLDSNMNRIARIGRYGNADDADPKFGKIHFAWLRAVAVSDVALYAADHGNRRIVRAALSYAAEETVPVP